jgi:single-strand DNA-binding protein
MSSINKVQLIGNLGADPELRYTSGGQPVADLRVATNRRFTGRDGAQQEDTQWHRVVVWGKQAEHCKEYLSKGRQVYVEGRLQTRSWEDRDGNKRWTTEVVAQTVQFLGARPDGKQSPDQDDAPPPSDSDAPSEGKQGDEEQKPIDHREIADKF